MESGSSLLFFYYSLIDLQKYHSKESCYSRICMPFHVHCTKENYSSNIAA